MKKISFFFLLVVCLYACKNRKAYNDFLSPANIKSQLFTIDPERDTVLRTSHAAILRIQKGSFGGNKQVSIEIREAYTPSEILLAGLTTTSNGKPLRSAGMLYFKATADGKELTPILPVNATIPSRNPDAEMQVFKGEETKEGVINWVEPIAIDTTAPESSKQLMARGKILFQKCASCHNIFRDMTGPSLKDLQYRGPWKNPKNILDWVNNPPKFMVSNKYTQNLKAEYGSIMTAFPALQMEDITAILAYLNSVKPGDIIPPAKDSLATIKADSTRSYYNEQDCGSDTTYIPYKEDFPEYDTSSYPEIIPDTTRYPASPYDLYYRDVYTEGYEFEIKGNGWYNIDAFLKTEENKVENVKLIADLKMEQETHMNVYVFIPSERIMQVTISKKGNQYYFDYENGTIPLPLGYRAVIFAYGSNKDKIFYGVSEFTIGKDQTIPVEIKETTKDKLKNILYSKRLDGIELEAVEKRMEINKIPCDDGLEINSADIVPSTDTIPIQ